MLALPDRVAAAPRGGVQRVQNPLQLVLELGDLAVRLVQRVLLGRARRLVLVVAAGDLRRRAGADLALLRGRQSAQRLRFGLRGLQVRGPAAQRAGGGAVAVLRLAEVVGQSAGGEADGAGVPARQLALPGAAILRIAVT